MTNKRLHRIKSATNAFYALESIWIFKKSNPKSAQAFIWCLFLIWHKILSNRKCGRFNKKRAQFLFTILQCVREKPISFAVRCGYLLVYFFSSSNVRSSHASYTRDHFVLFSSVWNWFTLNSVYFLLANYSTIQGSDIFLRWKKWCAKCFFSCLSCFIYKEFIFFRKGKRSSKLWRRTLACSANAITALNYDKNEAKKRIRVQKKRWWPMSIYVEPFTRSAHIFPMAKHTNLSQWMLFFRNALQKYRCKLSPIF